MSDGETQYVFVHGLGQNSSSWDKTISFFEKPHQVMCPNLMGLFEKREPTYTNLYAAFSDYCAAIPTPLNLCGLSLGGVLAMHYALDYPARVRTLVLIAAPYKMPRVLLALQHFVFRCMPASAFARAGLLKKDWIRLTNSMTDVDFSHRIENISCPTLVLCGDKDSANMKSCKGLAERIPTAALMLLAGAGHEVNTDKPKELSEALRRFYAMR